MHCTSALSACTGFFGACRECKALHPLMHAEEPRCTQEVHPLVHTEHRSPSAHAGNAPPAARRGCIPRRCTAAPCTPRPLATAPSGHAGAAPPHRTSAGRERTAPRYARQKPSPCFAEESGGGGGGGGGGGLRAREQRAGTRRARGPFKSDVNKVRPSLRGAAGVVTSLGRSGRRAVPVALRGAEAGGRGLSERARSEGWAGTAQARKGGRARRACALRRRRWWLRKGWGGGGGRVPGPAEAEAEGAEHEWSKMADHVQVRGGRGGPGGSGRFLSALPGLGRLQGRAAGRLRPSAACSRRAAVRLGRPRRGLGLRAGGGP